MAYSPLRFWGWQFAGHKNHIELEIALEAAYSKFPFVTVSGMGYY
jgi:hypothetical protein